MIVPFQTVEDPLLLPQIGQSPLVFLAVDFAARVAAFQDRFG
jgi:hypothetical protein